MRAVEVFGVRAQLPSNAPVVLLSELGTKRLLPVWVGELEAASIALVLEGVTPSRPLTHDLLLTALDAVGNHHLIRVEITSLTDSIFHAALVLENDARVDCRASDAIALALRAQAPILVADEVLDEAGVIADEDETETSDEDLERFREFLENINPEDFKGAE
jgi:bifunctional DNase/RNase